MVSRLVSRRLQIGNNWGPQPSKEAEQTEQEQTTSKTPYQQEKSSKKLPWGPWPWYVKAQPRGAKNQAKLWTDARNSPNRNKGQDYDDDINTLSPIRPSLRSTGISTGALHQLYTQNKAYVNEARRG